MKAQTIFRNKTMSNTKQKSFSTILALIVMIIVFITLFSSCETKKERTKNYGEPVLLYKTEHCRVICLQKNGWGKCVTAVAECDSGYNMNVSLANSQ